MKRAIAFLPLALAALFVAAPAQAARSHDLTAESAIRCGALQQFLIPVSADNPVQARRHEAMMLTWYAVGKRLSANEAAAKSVFEKVAADLGASLPPESAGDAAFITAVRDGLKPCGVMRVLNNDLYREEAEKWLVADPVLFADRAAYESQTGLPVPPQPEKRLSFGPWTLDATGSRCTANLTFSPGQIFTLGLTTFDDGNLRLASPALPRLDYATEDSGEKALAAHQAGTTVNEDYVSVLAVGVTRENYPGTALFLDGEFLSAFMDYPETAEPVTYVFGGLQKHFYPRLRLGRELEVVVLGKEKFRFRIDGDDAFWDELDNCVAEYPNG